MNEGALRIIADLLKARTGQSLDPERLWRVERALGDLLREYGLTNHEQLVCMMTHPAHADLPERVVEALLNHETYFFRDPVIFGRLQAEILPQLTERRTRCKRLNIWSAGCSTGQELMSIAMIFAREPARWADWRISLVGSDVSAKTIAAAQKGIFNRFEIQRGLAIGDILRHFEPLGDDWRARPALLGNVRFVQHNLLDEPMVGGPFDIVLCRNTLLYFDEGNRALALSRLRAAMASDGVLMMGAGEGLGGGHANFSAMASAGNFFVPAGADPRCERSDRPASRNATG